MSQARPGLLIAVIVFAVFAAYAFLAPATYRADALLVVGAANSANPVSLPVPIEAARRLSEGILDRVTLGRLARERAGSSSAEAQARAASSVRASLAIDTSDAHTFSISYSDSDPERARRVCNQLARHALERAPVVLLDRRQPNSLDLKRQQQTQELAAFLAEHPQVAAEPSPASPATSPDKDTAIAAFHAEEANLERRVAELESGLDSDNPYVDPAEPNAKQLRRRLAEIDAALSARRAALAAKPSTQPLAPELRSEWKHLLDAVAQSSAEQAPPPAPALVARLTAEASLPSAPIEPNRHLLLFLGAVFGTGLGAAFVLVARASQQRRKSGRPPAPATISVASGIPAAPLVPTSVGPIVTRGPTFAAATALPARMAPPIVPMPQRLISSSPPAPAPLETGLNVVAEGIPGPSKASPKTVSSNPPPGPVRFASTLVLPPAQNPTLFEEPPPEPALASAERTWDQQIRAHEVPGFAVVQPRSELEPATRSTSSAPPPEAPRATSSSVPARTASRPPNQMKVTQPLGSFIPDAVWSEPAKRAARQRTPPASYRTAVRSSPPRHSSEPLDSVYSYISSTPPAPAPQRLPVIVCPVSDSWAPDARLLPESRRPICEQLFPLAVDKCFVLGVLSVPESGDQKSRVAAEIALKFAQSGHPRVLLLEGDFHRPTLHRLLQVEMPMTGGFSQQLRSRVKRPEEVRWTVMGCSQSLHVLAEGMMLSPGLPLSRQFAECVADLRAFYDFIVIAGPSDSLEVDSKVLDTVLDGLVIVCPEKGSPDLTATQSLFTSKRFSYVCLMPPPAAT